MSPACCTHFRRIVMNRADTEFPTESSSRWQSVDLTSWCSLTFSQKAKSPSKISQGIRSRASQVALVVKNPPANAGGLRDMSLIPGSGRSSEGGHDNPLQYSCLDNPMDRGTCWATAHSVTTSQTWLKGLNTSAQEVEYSKYSPLGKYHLLTLILPQSNR